MRGFVNYYIDEEEENYEVLRGEKDIYKFKLSQTEIELRDPTKEDIPLETVRSDARPRTSIESRCIVRYSD